MVAFFDLAKTNTDVEVHPDVINIHDIFIEDTWRGHGVGRAMLQVVEQRAKEKDCAKLTLEVDRSNTGAQRLYTELGFGDGLEDSDGGGTWFWRKLLR